VGFGHEGHLGPFHLTDVDGETVWLNPAEVAVIEIPL
jgi:hypothetical protein